MQTQLPPSCLGIGLTTCEMAIGEEQPNECDLLAFASQKADHANAIIRGGCKARMTPPGIAEAAGRRGTGNLSRSPRKVRLFMPSAKIIFA
jgi:hypothetical protein